MFEENNMTFAFRLKKLREQKNLTQTELSELVGYKNYSTVSKWESGSSLPRGKELKTLSEYFGVSTDYLLGMDILKESGIMTIYNSLNIERQQKVYNFAEHQLKEQKKIYNFGSTAAGSALSYTEDFIEEEKLERIPDKADFVLTVKGDSMEPVIHNGSKVFVQSASMVENGQVAIVEIDGEGVTCKKVKYDFDNQKIILESFNEDYENKEYSNERIKIIGKVIK